ncbi:hypothetical protein ABPG74_001956 [Tetrahymena malaccensis]
MIVQILLFYSMVYLTTQQFDCPTTLQQTKPPNALGYKCMVASKTNFNSDFLFNVPRFQYYLQNAQTQMLPSAIQSRQPNCPNIVQASSDAIQISIDYSFSSQYLESVYVSFDLIYQGSADSFQIISQWNKVYFKGVYQKSDFPSITNDGCGYNLSKFVVKMNMPSDVLNANAVAISFQLFNGNNYRTVSISDFEILFYYKCPVGCAQSCANGQCSDCLSGYSLVSGQCVLQCTQGLFLKIDPNSTQQSCVSCIQNCDKCSDANSCDTCKSGFVYMKINNANQCVALCTQPAQYIDSQGVCQNCIQNCDKCSDANSCDTCKSGFVYMKINNANQCVAQCTQPAQYIDSQGVCQNCVQNCTSCSQANTCDTCAPQFVKNQQGTCDCLGYISNSQCLPCYSSCQTCSDGQKTSCKSCQNGYYPVLNPLSQTLFECLQACPNNYLFVNNQCKQCDTTNYKSCFNCPSTCRTCSSSQSTVCIDCFDGMQLNQNGKCSSLSDQRNLDFYFRSYNDIAVVSAVFSSQTPTLTFEFGLNIISPSVQCNQIFDDSTLGLLKASTCSISTSKIIVSLSQDATIMVTSTINIINTAQILKFVNQQPINNIYLLSVVQEPVSGQVILQYDQVTSYCNDVTFQIKAINNDAGRGFLNFQWVLDQIQNYDQSTIQNLNIIIQAANSQQQQTLVIPKQIFPPDINIAIILTYTFKTNFKGQTSASTFVQSVKQISVSAIQNLYPPVYRYVDLQVKFLFFTQECGKSGTNAVQDIYDIQITSQLLPSLNKHFPQYKSQVLNFDIPPYSVLTANANLDIQLQISIAKNQALSTTYSMSIPYSLSNLQLFIQNGVDNGNDKRILNDINQGDKNQFSTDSLRALAASVPQNLLQQQINMTDQIGNLLNNITLPNQGQLNLQGNLISIKTEQITAKNLQKYLYIQNEPQQSDQNIYNVVLTNYTSNPYIQTDGFLQYTNQLQNQTPGIQVSLNPVVKPFIQSINNGSNTTFDNSFQLQFSNIKPSKYNLTCLQQQSSQKWINSQCKMQGVISSSTVAPVSLAHIGQLEQIVSQEKQMSPIKRKKRSILQNKKQQQLNAQQDQIHQNDQNAQSYRWLQLNILQSGAQTNIQVTQISNQQSQDSQQQKNKIQEQENANSNENQSILSLCQKQKEEKDIQQINKQVKIDQESQAMKPSSIEIQSQQISENEINIVNMLKESKNTKKLQEASVFKKILIFHSFSSIFFVYSNEQSRAFRFSLFYLRVIHSLSISIIFDQQYNQEQILIISGINSVVIIVSAAIIQLIYKKRKIGQVIASFIMLSLLSLYYYVILSIISGQSESYSNRKVSSFFIMFGVDFLFFSTIISMFSIYIFNYIACGGSSNGVIIRLLNLLQIQYILENIKL